MLKNFCSLASLWKSEKKNNRRRFDDCFHPQVFDKRGETERGRGAAFYYLLLPALMTRFYFPRPFLAPKLHSDFH